MLETGAAAILQMALGRVGGILEAKKIAAMAEARALNAMVVETPERARTDAARADAKIARGEAGGRGGRGGPPPSRRSSRASRPRRSSGSGRAPG